MTILSGSDVALFVKERQAKQVRALRQSAKVLPRLAIIQTTQDPVTNTYVRLKQQYAQDILVETERHLISQSDIYATIEDLNQRADVHGIIVQLPLDDQRQTEEIVHLIDPKKDVDGLGSDQYFTPATPMAIAWLLAAYGVDLSTKSIAIVGQGRLVGAPLAKLWRENGYQISTYDSSTQDLTGELRQHDLIVTATGAPGLIVSDMVQIGAIVVDAGTASEHGKIVSDVASDVRTRDDLTITPEKGGVGPLTVAALIDNVISAARATVSSS
jgi:methylenetetrahydrofolate dehydrogenase (NADP+)/methenyltetrahydrofolate cyclohydrolase